MDSTSIEQFSYNLCWQISSPQALLRTWAHLCVSSVRAYWPALSATYPALRLETLRKLPVTAEICFDFAMVERIGAVNRLANEVSFPRVVFGSKYPLYYFESALLKVKESGLTEAQENMVFTENARRLISR